MATTPTSDDVFYYWVTNDSNTGTGTSTYTESVWSSWTGTGTGIGTGSTNYMDYTSAWVNWQTSEVKESEVRWVHKFTSPKKSVERLRAEKAQREIGTIWRSMLMVEDKERKLLAELTAQQLLEDIISEEELAHYKETGRLVVKGRKFDYVVTKDVGVYKVDKDKVKDLCIHLKNRYKYPQTDNVIGLKLMIESDESLFLKTANDNGELRNELTKKRILELVGKAA